MVSGVNLALLEVYFFFKCAQFMREDIVILSEIDVISYYWLMFTVMTGIWEAYFVQNRPHVKRISQQLLRDNTHVWTNDYPLNALHPRRFAMQFYAEYGAYADREYMVVRDDWSRLIESTHAFVCAGFSAAGVGDMIVFNPVLSQKCVLIAMSAQWMNSVLYIGQYMIQTREEYHINEDRPQFPTGKWLLARPFFYINVLWTVMPMYVVWMNLCNTI